MRLTCLLSFCLCLLPQGLLTTQAVRADEAIVYNRDIRPILTDMCFPCHGPDSAARKGDYRLDRRDDAIDLDLDAHPISRQSPFVDSAHDAE